VALVAQWCATDNAQALPIPAGNYPFDAVLPGNQFVGFNGTSFNTTGSTATATLGVSIDNGTYSQSYSTVSLTITSGFNVTSAFVFDSNNNGVGPGDPVFASLGSGSFSLDDLLGNILTGSFTTASFSSALGASAGSLSASDATGLTLIKGPQFQNVSGIDPTPTGFSISLSSIPGGVFTTPNGANIGQFFPVTINAFSNLATGSADVSGRINVVPEPGTAVLLLTGGLGVGLPALLRRRSRRSRR
jgi:hypothetical protein